MYAMYAEVTLVLIFPICKHAQLVLHQFIRNKYLREDQSMGQTF